MSAERGWIVDRPPAPADWHTPGWVETGGRHYVRPEAKQEVEKTESREID
jgi:hypothetical protein